MTLLYRRQARSTVAQLYRPHHPVLRTRVWSGSFARERDGRGHLVAVRRSVVCRSWAPDG